MLTTDENGKDARASDEPAKVKNAILKSIPLQINKHSQMLTRDENGKDARARQMAILKSIPLHINKVSQMLTTDKNDKDKVDSIID